MRASHVGGGLAGDIYEMLVTLMADIRRQAGASEKQIAEKNLQPQQTCYGGVADLIAPTSHFPGIHTIPIREFQAKTIN